MRKGKKIKSFVNSKLFFVVHRQYLQTFLIDLQAEVSRFRCRNFHCFAYFLKIFLDYHRFLSFISYPLVTVLHLKSFENNLFGSDFSIDKNKHVSMVKPSQEGELSFVEILLLSIYQNTSESVKPCFRKNPT